MCALVVQHFLQWGDLLLACAVGVQPLESCIEKGLEGFDVVCNAMGGLSLACMGWLRMKPVWTSPSSWRKRFPFLSGGLTGSVVSVAMMSSVTDGGWLV